MERWGVWRHLRKAVLDAGYPARFSEQLFYLRQGPESVDSLSWPLDREFFTRAFPTLYIAGTHNISNDPNTLPRKVVFGVPNRKNYSLFVFKHVPNHIIHFGSLSLYREPRIGNLTFLNRIYSQSNYNANLNIINFFFAGPSAWGTVAIRRSKSYVPLVAVKFVVWVANWTEVTASSFAGPNLGYRTSLLIRLLSRVITLLSLILPRFKKKVSF